MSLSDSLAVSTAVMRKKRPKVWGCLLIPFCAVVWIVGVYSFERWDGGTICISNLTYISKEDIFIRHSDDFLRSQHDFDINNTPPFNRQSAINFYQDHSDRFELVRLMSIRRPDQYWRAFFSPFSRQVDIRRKTYEDPEYDARIDSRNLKPVGSRPFSACSIHSRLVQFRGHYTN
jgi:hypothetical protein